MAAAGELTSDRRAVDAGRITAEPRWDKSRVEIFSDGVFAIAITLLVLDTRLEPSGYDHLRQALLNEWRLPGTPKRLSLNFGWLVPKRWTRH